MDDEANIYLLLTWIVVSKHCGCAWVSPSCREVGERKESHSRRVSIINPNFHTIQVVSHVICRNIQSYFSTLWTIGISFERCARAEFKNSTKALSNPLIHIMRWNKNNMPKRKSERARDVWYEIHKRLATASVYLSDPVLRQPLFLNLFSIELLPLKWNRTSNSNQIKKKQGLSLILRVDRLVQATKQNETIRRSDLELDTLSNHIHRLHRNWILQLQAHHAQELLVV